MHVFDRFTTYLGAIQAEMNRRGGPPFIHFIFATHQLAEGAKTVINGHMRRSMEEYGVDDGAVRATWARSPPDSVPEDLREQVWTMWQLHSFDAHKNHDPAIPPPTYPTTWGSWYRANYRQASNASLSYNSAYCPDDVYQICLNLIEAAEEEDEPLQ